MSYYANQAERLDLIAGLIALAEFLEDNEEDPAPKWVDVVVFPNESSCDAARHEIGGIAALIGTAARKSTTGHYVAALRLGPIEYRAIAKRVNPEEA